MVDLQARIELKGKGQRSCISARNVPRVHVVQILGSVLVLPQMLGADAEYLRVNVRRTKIGKYEEDSGLALALALVSALVKKPIPESILFVGDVGLHGEVLNTSQEKIDALNDAIDSFAVTSPLTVVCSPDNAVWINRSSTCTVCPVKSLRDAVAATWPGIAVELRA